ncbi:MAG: translation initiation factor IF-2 N-terminal domain-containing protein, partial [Acetatifactor sp.]|nr:translation initiation factor IF-2 N-terminal domain-containing protein [Acetatifactor sp.]
MAKIKVHELAKELDKQSKDILSFLQKKGIEAKVAQSSIEEAAAEMVRKAFGGSGAGEESAREAGTEKSGSVAAGKTVSAAEQTAAKAGKAEAKTGNAEAKAGKAEAKTGNAEAKAGKAEAKAGKAVAHAETEQTDEGSEGQ